MKIKKILTYLLTMALVMSLLPVPADIAKAGSKKTVTMTVGATKQLKLTKISKGKKVKWSSNNKKVAKVTKKGKVTAKKAGKAKITAKCGKKKYVYVVKVKAKKKKMPTTEAKTEKVTETVKVPDCDVAEEDKTTETNKTIEEKIEQTPTEETTRVEKVEYKKDLTEETASEVTTEEIATEEVTAQDLEIEETAADKQIAKKSVETPIPSIVYQAHVEDIGWMTAVKDGATAGTTGKAKRLEGLKIVLKDDKGNSMIKYRAHVQGNGWQDWKTSGQEAGTTHQEKRMEGIEIQLTGAYATKYDIYYRVHVAQYGWLGWAKNGEMAGSQGIALRMEAIEMKLVKKNQSFAVGGSPIVATPDITYQAHCADIGWMSKVGNRKIAGTTGQERQLEGIKINLLNTDGKNGIQYRAHVGEVGWQDWKTSGQLAGTTGQAKRMEAIEIKLAGDVANRFDIYYRVHVEDIGWLGWAKNGETAGTTGGARRAEAIQIQLVVKDAPVDREGDAYKKLNQTGNEDKAEKVIAVAKSQVGYLGKKSPSNLDDFTANSGGKYTKYARDMGKPNGEDWCTTFVIWCMQKAGISSDVYSTSLSVPTMRDWFAARGLFKLKGTYTPKPGDLVFFWGQTTVGHVGIVVAVSGNSVTTVEGNTGNSQVKMYYNRGAIYGYGIVNYSGEGTAVSNTSNPGSPYPIPTGILRSGSRGDSVKWVQKFANDVMGAGISVDGIYGSQTVNAVKNFQRQNGLSADGIVGTQTVAKMLAVWRH